MDNELIDKILLGNSREIQDLKKNAVLLQAFFDLAKQLSEIPETQNRFHEDSISLYQATVENQKIKDLESVLMDFFGKPVKSSDSKLPFTLKFSPSVKYLGGIQKEQCLFIKKIKTGEFYGALWPWKRDPNKITIHLGYTSTKMTDADYNALGVLLNKTISKHRMEKFQTAVEGRIHGISLPSFLQMSEMEESTFTLKVSRPGDEGRLYLRSGSLINAKTGDLSGSEAAYKIISWEQVSIAIEGHEPDIEKTIHEPLMHILMESLKIKDEAKAASSPETAPVKPAAPAAPQKKPVLSEKKQKPKKPAPKKKVPPTPPKPSEKPEVKPTTIYFKRAQNRAAPQKAKSPWARRILVLLIIAGILSVGGFYGKKILMTKQSERTYARMISSVNGAKSAQRRYHILKTYIDSNPGSSYISEAKKKMAEVALEIEEKDYEKTILAVNSLPLDETYEKKAVEIYSNFLKKYPKSAHTWHINDAIEGIRDLLSSNSYEKLKGVKALDFLERMEAYQSFLVQFPEGEQRKDVLRMISGLSKEYYHFLKTKADECDAEQNWDECLEHCNKFIASFKGSDYTGKVKALRKTIAGKKELFKVSELAKKAGGEDTRKRQFYRDYIAANPNTAAKEEILKEIAALDIKISEKNRWYQTKHFAGSGIYSVDERLNRLELYIHQNPSSAYLEEAKILRDRLAVEMQQNILKQQAAIRMQEEKAQQQAMIEKKRREKERIGKLQAQAVKQLLNSGKRFEQNGGLTFKDNLSGLTWCLLDSNQMLNGCLDYDSAQTYVKSLQVGGLRDWRLPTAGELALLYKNKPFFPDNREKWYWSSETYAKGFHTVVDVVTSKKETVFERAYRKPDACGTVRAVRP